MSVFYIVATSFGIRDTYNTLEEAKAGAAWHNEGYMQGTQYASDPKPSIIRCERIISYAHGEEDFNRV